MSRLEDLITKLCPDGVEYKALEDVMCYEQPTKYIVKSTAYSNDFDTPVLTAGASFILGYTDETKGVYAGTPNSPVIIFDDFTTAFHWVDFNFKVKSSAMKLLKAKDGKEVSLRYLYFAMRCINFSPAQHTRNWIQLYSKFLIPLPPLLIQDEIVRILDNFTELTKELTKELTARKQQYEYYRDSLLTFGDNVMVGTLGGISIKTYSGGTPLANCTEYYGGDIPWLRTHEVHFADIYDTKMRITSAALKNSATKWIPRDCVIIAISGATAGRSAINKIPLTTNQHCCCLEINPQKAYYRYVFYWVSSQYEKLKTLGQGPRSDLNSGIIKSYPIPIPPLAEQERIVAILDRFDTLVNDITTGLPAEIEARKQQYEYYRDKLLTFKERLL